MFALGGEADIGLVLNACTVRPSFACCGERTGYIVIIQLPSLIVCGREGVEQSEDRYIELYGLQLSFKKLRELIKI